MDSLIEISTYRNNNSETSQNKASINSEYTIMCFNSAGEKLLSLPWPFMHDKTTFILFE